MFNFFKRPAPQPEVTSKTLAEIELEHKAQPTPYTVSKILEILQNQPKLASALAGGVYYADNYINFKYKGFDVTLNPHNEKSNMTLKAPQAQRFITKYMTDMDETRTTGSMTTRIQVYEDLADTLDKVIAKNIAVPATLAGHKGVLGKQDDRPIFYIERLAERGHACVTDSEVTVWYQSEYDAHSEHNQNKVMEAITPGTVSHRCQIEHDETGTTKVTVPLTSSQDYTNQVTEILSDLATHARFFINYGEKNYGEVLFDDYTSDQVMEDGVTYTRYRQAVRNEHDPELMLYVPTTNTDVKLEVRKPGAQYQDIDYLVLPDDPIYNAVVAKPDCATIKLFECGTAHTLETHLEDIYKVVVEAINSPVPRFLADHSASSTPVFEHEANTPLQAAVKLDLDDLNQKQLGQ